MNRVASLRLVRRMKWSLSLRFGIGLALIATISTLSIDDYFRVYHAMFWWMRPRFANSIHWLPLYSWIDGSLIGLLGESRWVPRLVSLIVGSLGCFAGAIDATDPEERKTRFELSIWLPTSLVLFAVPLTEAMFGALILVHASRLARYRDSGRVLDGVLASVALLFATALRYEAWVLIPLAAGAFVSRAHFITGDRGFARRGEGHSRATEVVLALVPCSFPLAWFEHVRARTGDAVSFLDAVSSDQFGASTAIELVGGTSIGFASVFVLATSAAVSTALDSGAPARVRLMSTYACVFGGMILALVVVGQLPSQFPARLFHVPTLLAVSAMARWIRRLELRPTIVSALFAVVGLVTASRLESVRASDDVVAASVLRAALSDNRGATALVEGEFPEVTQFVADSNAPGRVVVERSGGRCAISVATCEFPCGRPSILDRLRFALVTDRAVEGRLHDLGFVEVRRVGRRTLLERADRSRPVCAGLR